MVLKNLEAGQLSLAQALVEKQGRVTHVRNDGSVGDPAELTFKMAWLSRDGHVCVKVLKDGEGFLRTYNLTKGGVIIAP